MYLAVLLLLSVAGSIGVASAVALGHLPRNVSLTELVYGSIVKLRAFSLNPTQPDKQVNIVTDFSLVSGEYSSIKSASLSWKSSTNPEGFLVELTDSDNPESKFILTYTDKQEFFEEVEAMRDLNGSDDELLSGSTLSEPVDCWLCGETEPHAYKAQIGDEIMFIGNLFGFCRTTLAGEAVYLCNDCCCNVHQTIIQSEDEFISPSEAVLQKL